MATGIFGKVKNSKIKFFCIIFTNSESFIKSGLTYSYIPQKIWKHNTDYFLLKLLKEMKEFK